VVFSFVAEQRWLRMVYRRIEFQDEEFYPIRIPALSANDLSEALKISSVRFPSEQGEINMLPICDEVIPTRARVVDPLYNPAWSTGILTRSTVELRINFFCFRMYVAFRSIRLSGFAN